MTFVVRKPTEKERRWISTQWFEELAFHKRTDRVPFFSGKSESSRKWMRSTQGGFWSTPYDAMLIRPADYRAAMRALVGSLMADADVLVAALPGELSDEALGWVAFRGDVLHYTRVLGLCRKRGIGRALFEATGLAADGPCSFMTRDGEAWLAALGSKLKEGAL